MKTIEEKCFDLLSETGLNWRVSKDALFTQDGRKTESFGIFRNDNAQWLGTVGDRYTPLQNAELATILLEATQGLNIEISRGGLLFKGEKVYLQAELPSEYIGKSPVKRWITCLNSHDGSTSVGFGSSNTVVVCENTFFRAFGELQKFRHTISMKERIAIAQNDLRATIELDQKLMVNYKQMADLPLRDEAIERVINKLFNINKDTVKSEISTRKENQVQAFANSIQQSVTEQGQTIWALFNGITRFANHVNAPKDISKKLDYLMVNGGSEFMNAGFDVLMAYTVETKPKIDYFQQNN